MSCNSLLSSTNADLARFYLLNEESGTTATDLSSAGSDGTYARDASLTTTTGPGGGFEVGQALDGLNDYMTAPYTPSYPMTLGVLVDPASNDEAFIGVGDADRASVYMTLTRISNELRVVYNNGGGPVFESTGENIVNGPFYDLVTVFYSDTSYEIYVDGVSVFGPSSHASYPLHADFDRLHVGTIASPSLATSLTGVVSRAIAFDTDLSAAEVSQLAAGPEPIWLGTGTHHFNVARGTAYWNCPSTAWGLPTYLNAASTDNGALTAEVRIVRDRGKATEAVVATTTGFSGSVACAGSTDNLTLELRVSNDGGYDDSLGDDADGWVSVAYLGLEAKLVGQWNLDEQSGTTAVDSSGNGNDGTYARDASNTYLSIADLGTIDGGQDFNGSSDYVDLASTVTACDASGEGTFVAWVQPAVNGVDNESFFGNGTNARRRLYINGANGRLYYVTSAASIKDASTPGSWPGAGEWVHLALVRRRDDTWQTFINGLPDQTTFTLDESFEIAEFGRSGSDADYLNGGMAGVRIYSRALTGPEIAQLYAQGPTALVDVGRVAHYKLEETSGTTVADSSASGNDGTSTSDMSTLTTTGMVGRGCHLDGTDYISAPWSGGFSYPTSLACAFKLDTLTDTAARTLVSLADADSAVVFWRAGVNNGGDSIIVSRRNTTDDSQSNAAALTTNWHTAAVVFHDADSYSVYFDGTLLATQTGLNSVSASANVDTLLIGLLRLSSPTQYADGITFDEVSAWTRELSASDAAAWHDFVVFPLAARHSAEPLGLETSLSL